ncbi:hypothetical protein ABIA13_006120 [Sinorhizobium fredii]
MHRVIERRPGYANAAGLGQSLQARGYVDAVAVDVIAFDNYIAEVDTDAKLNSLGLGDALSAVGQFPLDHGRTLDSVNDARKLNQRTIAHQLDDATMELRYSGINQFPAAGLQPL